MPSIKIHELLYEYQQNELAIRSKKEYWRKTLRPAVFNLITELTGGLDFGEFRPQQKETADGLQYMLHRSYDKIDIPGKEPIEDYSYIEFKQGFNGAINVWFFVNNPIIEKSWLQGVFEPQSVFEVQYKPIIEDILVNFLKSLKPEADSNIGHTKYL